MSLTEPCSWGDLTYDTWYKMNSAETAYDLAVAYVVEVLSIRNKAQCIIFHCNDLPVFVNKNIFQWKTNYNNISYLYNRQISELILSDYGIIAQM